MVAIFVIFTILLFIAVEFFSQRRAEKIALRSPATARRPEPVSFQFPRGYFLSPSHSWVELAYNGTVRLGVDDFVRKLAGSIDSVTTAAKEASLKRGDTLLTIQQGDRTLTIPSPISGKVVQTNQALSKSAGLLSTDPYFEGWAVEIEPSDFANDVKALKIADDATAWFKREISRFRDFIREAAGHGGNPELAVTGATLLDGGIPLAGVLQHTDAATWEAFEREFLLSSRSN